MTDKRAKILITGAGGFIGKNLVQHLAAAGYSNLVFFEAQHTEADLELFTKDCAFVYHLAGVNRPKDAAEFASGNHGLTKTLLAMLAKHGNTCPIVITSSTQAALDNDYGKSKLAAEQELAQYAQASGARVYIYRLPGVFGKWARPNYNSVVATFCHNIANGLPITINDEQAEVTLCHIDDVCTTFINDMEKQRAYGKITPTITPVFTVTLGALAQKLYAYKANRETLVMPPFETDFDHKLYGTYVSYLPESDFSYMLKKNSDDRGWLAEFIKSPPFGQIFVSKTKPGVTRGNHWHHTKSEKFYVVQGKAAIKFRNIASGDIVQLFVDGEQPQVVDIPTGYTHYIKNIGDDDVICIFYATEIFDKEKPDTMYAEVD